MLSRVGAAEHALYEDGNASPEDPTPPERVKKLEGQVDNVLTDLAKISGSLEKLEKMGYSLAKVAEALGKLTDFQTNQEVPSGPGGKEYIA